MGVENEKNLADVICECSLTTVGKILATLNLYCLGTPRFVAMIDKFVFFTSWAKFSGKKHQTCNPNSTFLKPTHPAIISGRPYVHISNKG